MNKAFIKAEIRESFSMALAALAAHKLRSALTLLGVTVGVFSIILVMTAMRALQNNIEGELSQLGANTFVVQKWPEIYVGGPEGWEKFWRRLNLRMPLVLQLRERATLAANIGAESYLWTTEAISKYAKTNPDINLIGVTPEVFSARNWNVEEGRAILGSDIDSARNVCVLGNALATKLFPRGSALGEHVKYQGINYNVVGVLASKGGMVGGDQDKFVAVPLSTGLNRYSHYRSLSILVQAQSQALFEETVEQVRGILRTIRKVPPGKDDDFEIISNDSLIQQFQSLTLAVRIGVTVISCIALLAAGVGIMNIMLVSVTERTSEIGVRRAIGAKKRNILAQFIMEAVVVCEIGGVIGIAIGLIGGNLGAYYMQVEPAIPFDWVVISLVICSLIGIVFGTYPALKAANVDPIDALRYE
jgi:putative ABC transport system permease protein